MKGINRSKGREMYLLLIHSLLQTVTAENQRETRFFIHILASGKAP